MCNKVDEQVLKEHGFLQSKVWTKETGKGTVILIKDGDSLYLPRYEKNGTNKEFCYDNYHSSGIPGERITTVEELEEYLAKIKNII